MPGGKDTPEELLHLEPRVRSPREDLRVHRLKVEDPDLDPQKREGVAMKTSAVISRPKKDTMVRVLSQIANKLEASGSKQAALSLDRVQNELDAVCPEGKAGGSLSLEQKQAITGVLDGIAGGLQKAGAKQAAEAIDRIQNELDALFEGDKQAEGDCAGCDRPDKGEAVVSDLDEESESSKAASEADVIMVKVTSAVRLVGEPDKFGFRVPSFVKEATKAKWAEAVQVLVDSGKGYHQDGSPNYGKVIDQYKSSL